MIDAPPNAVAVGLGALWRRALSVRGEMVWIAIGQAAAASGGIVGVKLLTHWLSPDIYGQLALGLTLTTLIQQTILSPFASATLRFFSAACEAGELASFLSALKEILRAAVLTVASGVIIGIAVVFFSHQGAWIPIIIWCAVFALFSSFSHALDGMQNAARQRVVVAWHDGLGVWLRFIMGAVAVIFLGAHAANALFGYALAALLVFWSQYYFFHRRLLRYKTDIPDQGKAEKWKRAIVDYGWPFASWGIFVWMQGSSERWALQIFGDTALVGQYAVLFQLGYYPIMMANGIVMQLVSPILFRMAGDGTDVRRLEECRRWAIVLAAGSLTITGIAVFLARLLGGKILSFIAAPSYLPAASMLPWMVLSAGIFWSGQYGGLLLMSQTSTKSLVAPKIGTALLAVGMNIWGAYELGLKGVVLASNVFSIVHFVWTMGLVALRVGWRSQAELNEQLQAG